MAGKVKKTQFQKNLQQAESIGNETQIQGYWTAEIRRVLPKAQIATDVHSDGVLTFDSIHSLLEFKDKKGFKTKQIRCTVLMQALFYLKALHKRGQYPSTIFVGDGSECFFLKTDVLNEYLNRNEKIFTLEGKEQFNWEVPASQAYLHHQKILKEMVKDENLDMYYKYNVQDATFRVKDIIPILNSISKHWGHRIKINKDNLIPAFQYFKANVIGGTKTPHISVSNELNRVSTLIDVFYNLITDKNTTGQIHANQIISHGETFNVNQKQFEQFFKLFSRENYSITEKEELVAIKDRVLEEMTRRMTGAYFTPEVWIDKAHKMIAEQFGNDWKERYTVWDCASGTNNLTHKQFNPQHQLYNSTLLIGDINTVKDMDYTGTTFQYDFLNEDEYKLPDKLKKTLEEKKPLLFLINPPYGTSGGKISGKGENKPEISTKTLINIAMKSGGIGACADQLYAQFLYRIIMIKKEHQLSNINICLFSTPLFMSGESYTKFRELFYNHFTYKDGIIFQANQFGKEVSGDWGIAFTIWEGKNAIENM